MIIIEPKYITTIPEKLSDTILKILRKVQEKQESLEIEYLKQYDR